MKNYGIEVAEGSVITNISVPTGSDFPSSPNNGEMFYKTSDNNLYVYKNGEWSIILSTASGYLELSGGTLTGDLRVNADIGINRDARTSLDVGGDVLVQPTTATNANISLRHGSLNTSSGLTSNASGVLSLFVSDNVTSLSINNSGVATFASTPYVNGYKIWHENNDGTGSLLDADLLDGQEGSYYLDWTNTTNKPDPTITLTGDITGAGTLTNLGSVSITTTLAASAANKIFYGNTKVEIPTPNGAIISTTNGIERMKISSNGAVDIKHVTFLGGNQTTSQVGTVLTTSTYVEDYGEAITISAAAQTIVVGAPGYVGDNVQDGRVAVYDWSGTNWAQRGSWLENYDAYSDVRFGSSVALSEDGNYLYVGAEYWDDNNAPIRRGRVYMYQRDNLTWTHVTSLYGSVAEMHYGSGVAVSADNTILAVGAKGYSTPHNDQGGVYIYDWSGSAWVQRGSILTAPDAAASDKFGWDVSLSADGTLLAARSFSGLYIFEWSGSTWNLVGTKITKAGSTTVNSCAISADGSTVAFGAINEATGGRTYVYDWSGSAWVQRENFQAPDAQTNFGFGSSVAFSADESILVVGAYSWNLNYPTSIGGVYTFALQGNGNYGIPDTSSDRTLVGYNSSVSHSFTAEAEANTFFTIGKNDSSTGGVEFRGFTETDDAVCITGYSTTPNTSSSAVGVVRLNAKKLSGLFGGTVANGENLLTVENNGAVKFVVKGNGDIITSGSLTATSVSGSASSLTTARNITATGDASWTVSFDGSTDVSASLTLSNSGVTSGTYNNSSTTITPFNVDSKGRITSTGAAVTITPNWSSITNTPTTLSGYGITDAASSTGTTYVGTTEIGLNRASANQALTGILSVTMPGSTSGSVLLQPAAIAGTTTITLPATTGTLITTGDTGTVTDTMLAGSISNAKLTNSSITIGSTSVSLGGTASSIAGLSTVNGLSLTSNATGFSIAGGTTSKTLTIQNTLTLQGTDASAVNFGSGGTVAYTSGNLSQFASTTSAQLASIISDETGTGALVFGTSPAVTTSLTTPSTSFALLNTTATTINFAGAATTLNIGAGTGTTLINNNLSVVGNLTVNGTTTTVNSTVVSVDDPVFTLGGDVAPTTDDNKDRGIEFRWHNGSAAKVGFFGFDDSTGKFTFIPDATNTSEVFSGTKGTIDANIAWSNVTGTPTTLSGYGITDAASSSHTHSQISNGTSNVNIPSSNGDISITRAGSTQATFAASMFTVNNNVTISNSSARLYVDAAGGSPQIQFLRSAVLDALIGTSSTTDNTIVGSTAGDLCFRTASSDMLFSTDNGSTSSMMITTGGQVLVGKSTSRAIGGVTADVQVEATDSSASFALCRNSNDASSSYILLAKARGTTVGSNTLVQDGDVLGTIQFSGGDGNDTSSAGAAIQCRVDGTAALDNMPSRLIFSTTPSGSNAPTERMVIKNTGNIGVGTLAPSALFHARVVLDASAEIARFENINTGLTDNAFLKIIADNASNLVGYDSSGTSSGAHAWYSGGSHVMRLTSSGNLLVGTTTEPSGTRLHISGGAQRTAQSGGAYVFVEDTAVTDGNRPFGYISNVGGVVSIGNANRSGTATTGSANRINIAADGKVAIGTTADTAQLKVTSSAVNVPAELINGLYVYTWAASKPSSTSVTITFTANSYFNGKLTFMYCHTNGGNSQSAFSEGFFSYNSSTGSWIETVANNLTTTGTGTITFVTNDVSKTLTITMPAGNASSGYYSFKMESLVALNTITVV